MPRSFSRRRTRFIIHWCLNPRGTRSDEAINYNLMSWGYWSYSFVPAISRYKWLETRHMVNVCNRWAHNHVDDLQHAFFNGVGFESWENIWGIWNQITPQDAEALRRIAAIERQYKMLVSAAWEPHVHTEQFGIFASKWPQGDRTLWTIVNRNHYPVTGVQLRLPVEQGAKYFEVWHGVDWFHGRTQENRSSRFRWRQMDTEPC